MKTIQEGKKLWTWSIYITFFKFIFMCDFMLILGYKKNLTRIVSENIGLCIFIYFTCL